MKKKEKEEEKSKLKIEQWIASFGFDFSSWSKCKCKWAKKTKNQLWQYSCRGLPTDGAVRVCRSQISAVSINYIFFCLSFFFGDFFSLLRWLQPGLASTSTSAGIPFVRAACVHIWAHIKSVRADGWGRLLSFLIRFLDFPHCEDYKCATSRRGDDKIFKCVNARSSERTTERKTKEKV